MGAPKQRWTAEEEDALKAGMAKYGQGKWSLILKDPEFSAVLSSRSNVDLKDKWRNMYIMSNGLGSRQRARPAPRNIQLIPKANNQLIPKVDNQLIPKLDNQLIPKAENQLILVADGASTSPTTVIAHDIDKLNTDPIPVPNESLENGDSRMTSSSLDNLILEAIANLKEPRGSGRAAIATYIEDKYFAPPNLEKLLAADLKILTENGKLIKVKHQYRIAPSPLLTGQSALLLEEKKESCLKKETNTIKMITKAQVDADLEKMRRMTPQEADAAAIQAVAEAEAAVAEAEEAAREADVAEADAEVAQAFSRAAKNALNHRSTLRRCGGWCYS